MNEIRQNPERVIELLEQIAQTQTKIHERQLKQYKLYSYSAVLVWLVYGSVFIGILYATFKAFT